MRGLRTLAEGMSVARMVVDAESGRIRLVRGEDTSSSSKQRNALQPTKNDRRERAAAIFRRLTSFNHCSASLDLIERES
jgi:hypothetical protein